MIADALAGALECFLRAAAMVAAYSDLALGWCVVNSTLPTSLPLQTSVVSSSRRAHPTDFRRQPLGPAEVA